MQKNITQLGPREAEFISRLAASAGIVTLREAKQFWKTKKLAYDVLQRLERKGWLARIEPGKYIVVPLEAGPERQWSQDTYLVASSLAKPSAIAYWTALHHWNWTEQIPRIIFVQTTQRKNRKQRTVFGVKYEFVTVDERKFFGNLKEWRNGKHVLVTDKEKTLIDCADDIERAGTIEELAKAVKSAAGEINWSKLNKYIARFPNGAVPKRLGCLFETLLPALPVEAEEVLAVWRKNLSAGVVPLQPMKVKEGKIATRWRVLMNARIG